MEARDAEIRMSAAPARPDLSIVIPFYNRADTLPYTMASVAFARHGLKVETILVDDGSTPPAAEQLRGAVNPADRTIRQENQGLLFARLTGLKAATGEYVLFLDSDDLVGPEKFTAQISAMRASGADVSYTDCAEAELGSPVEPRPLDPAEATDDSTVFFIRVQPQPHSPIFRTDWLRPLVAATNYAPTKHYNPVAEIWFYHLGAMHAAKVIKVPGPHTIVGHHAGARLTGTWERLAIASLAVMEGFQRACPASPETAPARRLVGEKAFNSWRRLPYDFSPEFRRRMLDLWRRSPRGDLAALGGGKFATLARFLGPILAGWLLRRFTGQPYSASRRLKDDQTFPQSLAQLPAP